MVSNKIRPLAASLAVMLAAGALPARAEPGGCLKYGAAGAVGGHLVHHGVVGAVGGCATGMYVRHKYRKEAKRKAALYDQEHPGTKGSYEQKATAYDVEHSTKPGSLPDDGAPPATNTPADSRSDRSF